MMDAIERAHAAREHAAGRVIPFWRFYLTQIIGVFAMVFFGLLHDSPWRWALVIGWSTATYILMQPYIRRMIS